MTARDKALCALEAAYHFLLREYGDPASQALEGETVAYEARAVFSQICGALASLNEEAR